AGAPPYRISPFDGSESVATSDSSVDLPAPFGPSKPMMSPLLAVSVTSPSARRRPKCRDTSVRLTESKSRPESGSGIGVVVERAVHMLERGDELFAAMAVPGRIDAAAAVVTFELDQLAQQLLAAGRQPLAIGHAARGIRVVSP